MNNDNRDDQDGRPDGDAEQQLGFDSDSFEPDSPGNRQDRFFNAFDDETTEIDDIEPGDYGDDFDADSDLAADDARDDTIDLWGEDADEGDGESTSGLNAAEELKAMWDDDPEPEPAIEAASVSQPIETTEPEADAGPHQSAETGVLVTLDGRGSSDPDGDALTYAWTEDAGNPETGLLSDNTAVMPTFTPTAVGTYSFVLVVNDKQMVEQRYITTGDTEETPWYYLEQQAGAITVSGMYLTSVSSGGKPRSSSTSANLLIALR